MADRLFLRPFAEGDAEGFHEGVFSCMELQECFGLTGVPSFPDAQRYVHERAVRAEKKRFYDRVIVRACDGVIVGEINAAFIAPDTADVGYVIGTSFQNRGYAVCALQQMISELHDEGIRNVYGACRADNFKSAAVMKHCGMIPASMVPEAVKEKEESEDLIWFYKAL